LGGWFRCICGPFTIRAVSGIPPEAWLRITLTTVPIDPETFANVGGWDGSGPASGFEYGETEDWYMTNGHAEAFPPSPPPPDPTKCKEKSAISLIDSERCPAPIKIPCDNSKPARFKIRIHNSGCRKIIIMHPPNWRVKGRAVNIKPVGDWPIVLQPCETAMIEFEATWAVPCKPGRRFHVCCAWEVQAQATPNWGIDPDGEEFDYEPTAPEPLATTYPYLKTVLFDQPDWPMFGGDVNHTRFSPSNAPNTNEVQWSYTTGGYVESSPAVADGRVYVGSDDNNVYALQCETGTILWTYTTGDRVLSSPAVAEGRVYVGSEDKKIYCLNASTGAHIWDYTTGHWVDSSPAFADGRVYVGSFDFKVYCLNASTGAHIWDYTTGAAVVSSPAVYCGKIYVGSGDQNVYCLNSTTGAYIWSKATVHRFDSSPAVDDDRVYVGSLDNKLHCLNASTGASIWSYTTGGYIVSSSPAVAYGRVYVGSFDNKLYCLNASTGAHIWDYTAGSWVDTSPAVANGKVYVGSNDYKVYCLNATTGAQIWNYVTGLFVKSSPAVDNGKVYIGSDDGKIYAFADHDVAVEDAGLSDTLVASGYSLPVVVYVVNHGSYTETFSVTAYANATPIATQVVTLSSGASTTITFTWSTSGFARGTYIISGVAWPVMDETDLRDNVYSDGIVYVAIPGDVDANGMVNMLDLYYTALHFGTTRGQPDYLSNCDIDRNNVINMLDLYIAATHYGQHN
jgi:outer membrane protein assembly factor BamB